MERLQAAIEKARAVREGNLQGEVAGKPRPPQARPASTRSTPERIAEAWAALESFEPEPRYLERNRIVSAFDNHRSLEGVEFDKLRTKLVQQMQAKGWKRLAVTSPGTQCGKSTTVLNLGFSLARRAEERVVICEMDFRRPSLAKLLGIGGRKRSFAQVLSGSSSFAEQGVRIGRNLALGLANRPRRHAAELLQSPSTKQALEEIDAIYEPSLMIFDTPPVFISDDTSGLLERADCTLLVAAAGTTSISDIDRCEREVSAQSEVIGVVLNKCSFPDRGASYDYYG